MKNYILYSDNGQILRTGVCADNDFNLQGQNVIEGNANDSTQYIQDNKIINMPPKPDGAAYFDYGIKQWILDYPAQEQIIKKQRDYLLYQSDWTQIQNNPLTPEKQEEWAIYRQQLRDITEQAGYPFDVVWPTKPE